MDMVHIFGVLPVHMRKKRESCDDVKLSVDKTRKATRRQSNGYWQLQNISSATSAK